jgi:hypothetical protein
VKTWAVRLVVVAVTTAIAGSAVSGCASAPQSRNSNPYAAQIAQAEALASSPFEKAVFADYNNPKFRITRSVYVEAMQKYAACLKGKGVTLQLSEQYGLFGEQVSGAENIPLFQKDDGSCSKGTTRLIEPLYVDMLTNPDNVDFNTVVAACFVRSKLVAPPFTAEDLKKLEAAASAGSATTTTPSNGTSTVSPSAGHGAGSDAAKVMGSSGAAACETNPQYNAKRPND